jgi:hypothetical protein
MDKFEKEISEVSFAKSVKEGCSMFLSSFRKAARVLLWLSAAIAVVAAVAFGGNIGNVKTDYITYMPFHEVSMHSFIIYACGLLAMLLLYVFWRGAAFLVVANADGHSFERKSLLLSGLKFLQFCLLAFLVFGVLAVVLVVLAVKISLWFWIAVAVYVIAVSVPLAISQYDYMLTDNNFRRSLRVAFRVLKEQWGRVFFRLFVVVAAVALCFAVFSLPAATLALAVYDNATAVSMEKASATPFFVFALEYVFIAVGVLAQLVVSFMAITQMSVFYKECLQYSEALLAGRKAEY